MNYRVLRGEKITGERTLEVGTQRLGSLARALARCNAAALDTNSDDELYACICDTLIRVGGLASAWVARLDPEARRLCLTASYGLGEAQNEVFPIPLDGDDSANPAPQAAHQQRPIWAHTADTPFASPTEQTMTAALPLWRAGQVEAVLGLHAPSGEAFNGEAQELLAAIAGAVSAGLDHRDRESRRRQTEQRLAESENRFQGLLETVPTVAMQGYGMDGITRYWNRASEHLYGYKAEEAIGRSLLDLIIPPEMHDDVVAGIQHMANTGEVIPASELSLVRKDGSRVTVFSSHASVTGVDGDTELFCIDVDLTERKKVEEALRNSEAEFRTLIESMPQIVWVTQPDGWHTHFNQHWMDYTGLTLEQSLGDGWNPPFHPDDRGRAAVLWQQATNTGTPYEIEYRLRRHDGVYRWMLGRALPLRNETGEIVKWFGTCTDIDDLKRAQERLDEAQRVGRIGDWELDTATGAMTWSPQIFDLLGRDPALGPPQGQNEHGMLYTSASATLWQEHINRVITSGASQEFELVANHPIGADVHVHIVAVPRTDDDGTVVGVYGTLQDVSARKRAEQALASRAHQQVLVARLGRMALSTTDVEHVFDEAAKAISEGLGVEYSKLLALDDDRDALVLRAGVGWHAEWFGRVANPDGAAYSLADHVIASGESVIVDDFGEENRFAPSPLLNDHGIVSGIEVPIGGDGRPWGVLGAYAPQRRKFSTDDLGFLQSLANTLSAAIERQRSDERLAYIAQHDPLTDLPNRALFTDRLNVALARAERSGNPLALLFIDLDHFKNVNDVFGHPLGDQVLCEVAKRLTHAVRATDTVSRQGGDEFLVVLPEITEEQEAARVAEKLLAAITGRFVLEGTEVTLGGSIGIACFPSNGTDATALARNADAAMYVAKQQGRNRYQFYSAEMNARAHDRLILESDLHQAIERDELFVVYQPQVDLATDTVVGLEALLRWRHPSRGLVPPAQFIPIAEERGLIGAIGAWVLASACEQHAAWLEQGLIDGTIAVNVSVRQFQQPDFVEMVEDVLARARLPAERLEIEVTESLFMDNLEMVQCKLNALHRLGVKLAIDDFGTGYSNLSYLKQLPLHRLKIDKSFTTGLPEDQENSAIAHAIIHMGRSLGLNILAEGIETRPQEKHVRSLSCDVAQGYLYTHPLAADACAMFLQQRIR
ncbi:EAL domain-containing protein [Aquisalimonas lutea]|uniref:bifunctional diguanylate cyclase/phosphodiesterase n=1 Tax=Aquisalimonas lutea TaxID=1327750 RepID=UPI0025B59E30|nr:EAL domain-containing protein [Aquisalimonas lutea]MDN3517155.1 EAL domain-containing protein [Aquisalimonas lutea]